MGLSESITLIVCAVSAAPSTSDEVPTVSKDTHEDSFCFIISNLCILDIELHRNFIFTAMKRMVSAADGANVQPYCDNHSCQSTCASQGWRMGLCNAAGVCWCYSLFDSSYGDLYFRALYPCLFAMTILLFDNDDCKLIVLLKLHNKLMV